MSRSIGMFVKEDQHQEKSQDHHQKFFWLINNYACQNYFLPNS